MEQCPRCMKVLDLSAEESSNCHDCNVILVKLLRSELDNKITELALQKSQSTLPRTFLIQNVESQCTLRMIKELQSSLSFLQPPLDKEQTQNGMPKADLLILVQDGKDEPLYAHKFILAAKSAVFRYRLETEMREKEIGVILIHDATLPVVRAMIKFCYNAHINFNDEVIAEEVLEVAHNYGVNLLVQLCVEQLATTLDKGNLPRRFKLAKRFGLKGLQAQAFQYWETNFDVGVGWKLGRWFAKKSEAFSFGRVFLNKSPASTVDYIRLERHLYG